MQILTRLILETILVRITGVDRINVADTRRPTPAALASQTPLAAR